MLRDANVQVKPSYKKKQTKKDFQNFVKDEEVKLVGCSMFTLLFPAPLLWHNVLVVYVTLWHIFSNFRMVYVGN